MDMKEKAKEKLDKAYEEALSNMETTCDHKDLIDLVIDNTHLTYKYILFNALLSKATNENINPLCLQKGSELPGSYDARTICHKVIVPFEMETLDKVLGGSNEPFLNKPARYTELSKNNAVRRGNDQLLLDALCDELPLIETSQDAYECLVYLLTKLIRIRDEKESHLVFSVEDSADLPINLMEYLEDALKESYEGEVLTLLIAGIYHLLYDNDNVTVEVHPVNQSGASGREVSDLDVYVDDTLISSNELKDKRYAETDVRHAADKVLNAGGTRLLFIEGPRGAADDDFIETIENEYATRNFLLRIISYRYFFATTVGSIKSIDVHEFLRFIIQTAHETKFKEETTKYLINLAKDIFAFEYSTD